MDDDNTFRLVLLILCMMIMPVGAYHRFRSATDEKLDRWQEGVFILFGLRLTGLVGLVAGIAWMIQPQWMAWSSMPIPTWSRWIGIALVVTAGLLVSYAFHNLGKNLTDTVVTRRDHSLILTGPYRWVRHPFYVACGLGMLGKSLAMANWFFLVVFVIGFSFIYVRTTMEEERLIARFGDGYRDYMSRVGRFVPRVGGKL